MPGVDGGGGHIRHDESHAQPRRAEARHEDDQRHDHHDSQAEEVSTGSEAMLGVTEDPIHLYGQGYKQEARQGSGGRAGGHEEVVPGTRIVGDQLLWQRIRMHARPLSGRKRLLESEGQWAYVALDLTSALDAP